MIIANETNYMSHVLINNPIEKCTNFLRCGIMAVVLCEGTEECEYNIFGVYNNKQIVLQERY